LPSAQPVIWKAPVADQNEREPGRGGDADAGRHAEPHAGIGAGNGIDHTLKAPAPKVTTATPEPAMIARRRIGG